VPCEKEQTSLTLSSYQNAYVGNLAAGWIESDWVPVPALNRTDADVSAFLLSANAVQYLGAVDDPWFSTHVATVVNDSSSYGIQEYPLHKWPLGRCLGLRRPIPDLQPNKQKMHRVVRKLCRQGGSR
jgi:hypothetical protein